jgi:lactate 2-monooxygenase
MANFGDFQTEIYLRGMAGERPALPVTFAELERAAREAMPAETLGYVAGGAGADRTGRANVEAFDRWRIMPRALRGVAERDYGSTLLGTPLPAPIMLAPIGVLGLVQPEAEKLAAQAAGALGVPMVLSTVSTVPMEDVATELAGSPGWYQLYWPTDREVTASLVGRAEKAGYRAIVVTIDTPMLAWRPSDLANGFLPFLRALGLANYFTDPAFRAGLEKPPEEEPAAAVLRWISMFSNPQLTWADLAWLRTVTTLPIVLKGVCHPGDGRRAVEAGVDGIIVSNHGGRQVDGAAGALDCLPGVVSAVGDLPVLFDSGIRTGSDIAKAVALGARAVLVGRPYVYGLALGGGDGITHVLRCLLAEFDLTCALAGVRSMAELTADVLVAAP